MVGLELIACLLLTGTIVSAGNIRRSGFKPPGPINNAPTIEASIPEINAGILVVENEVLPRFNKFRNEYGAPSIAAMDAALVTKAQNCADELTKRHPDPTNAYVDVPSDPAILCDRDSLALQYFQLGDVGQTVERYVARSAVEKWLDDEEEIFENALTEELHYDPDTRHFTQIIWKGLTSLGCAVSSEPDIVYNRKIFVCFFSPAGNVEYGRNNVAFRANIGEKAR